MSRNAIMRVLQKHIHDGRFDPSLLTLLERIAGDKSLTEDEQLLKTFIVALHAILGDAARGSINLKTVDPHCKDLSREMRVAALTLSDASPEELMQLHKIIGQLLYGSAWQPGPKN